MTRIQDLCFRYPQGDFSLQIDHLSIGVGERVSCTGPSGSGKSTLLHLLAGIVSPDTGRIKTCGEELTSLSDGARRNLRIAQIGLVFQDFALLDYLSVLDNILLPYRINRSLRLELSVRDRARQLATDVGLEDLMQRRPTELSQGERQRVAVCRALIASPQLVLADEPTANLDADNANHVLRALDQHAESKQATLIVVTHDQSMIPRFDRNIDMSSLGNSASTPGGEANFNER